MTEDIQNIVSGLLIAFMVINVLVTWKLFEIARDSGWQYAALNERLFSAGVKTTASIILAILGFNRIFGWNLGDERAVWLLIAAVALHSLPPVLWAYYYLTGKFDRTIKDLTIPPADEE